MLKVIILICAIGTPCDETHYTDYRLAYRLATTPFDCWALASEELATTVGNVGDGYEQHVKCVPNDRIKKP
jgi:hypothetical protein